MGTFVVGPSRKGSLVSRVFAMMKRDAAAERKAEKAGRKAPKAERSPAKAEQKPEVARPKAVILSSPTYERNARKYLTCRHCGKKPLFPQFCHRDETKAGTRKTDVREGWVGCGPDLNTSEPGCHWLIGTSGTFSKADRRAMDLQYGKSTRAEMRERRLWPKNLPDWTET